MWGSECMQVGAIFSGASPLVSRSGENAQGEIWFMWRLVIEPKAELGIEYADNEAQRDAKTAKGIGAVKVGGRSLPYL